MKPVLVKKAHRYAAGSLASLIFDCYKTFLLTTDAGKNIISKNTIRASKKVTKEKKQEKAKEKNKVNK